MVVRTESAGIETVLSRNDIYYAFTKALRLSVGRGCRYSYKEAQRKSGVPARMIEAYRYDIGHPEHRWATVEDIFSLMRGLGPEFSSDVLEICDQGTFWLPEPGEDPDLNRIAVEVVQDAAEVSTIAAKGGNVHDLRDAASRMKRNGASLLHGAQKVQPDLFSGSRAA